MRSDGGCWNRELSGCPDVSRQVSIVKLAAVPEDSSIAAVYQLDCLFRQDVKPGLNLSLVCEWLAFEKTAALRLIENLKDPLEISVLVLSYARAMRPNAKSGPLDRGNVRVPATKGTRALTKRHSQARSLREDGLGQENPLEGRLRRGGPRLIGASRQPGASDWIPVTLASIPISDEASGTVIPPGRQLGA